MFKIDQSWYERPEGVPEETAAGGLVARVDASRRVLVALAHERGTDSVVLPKGHLKRGESLDAAARREIAEESGFHGLVLLDELGVLERLNYDRTRWKITHYFLYGTRQTHAQPQDKRHLPPVWALLDDRPTIAWPEQEALVAESTERIRTAVLAWHDRVAGPDAPPATLD